MTWTHGRRNPNTVHRHSQQNRTSKVPRFFARHHDPHWAIVFGAWEIVSSFLACLFVLVLHQLWQNNCIFLISKIKTFIKYLLFNQSKWKGFYEHERNNALVLSTSRHFLVFLILFVAIDWNSKFISTFSFHIPIWLCDLTV